MRKRRISMAVWILAVCVPLFSGCDTVKEYTFTGRLWNDDNALIDHYIPVHDGEVKLFQTADGKDVLVRYDETRESKFATRHRAYFLLANEKLVKQRRKPHFVSTNMAVNMEPIPLLAEGKSDSTSKVWAEWMPGGYGFKLEGEGYQGGTYYLPVYMARSGRAKQILLTPGTVTLDAVVAGSVVGIIYLACRYQTPASTSDYMASK